jgi:hypothetical protein
MSAMLKEFIYTRGFLMHCDNKVDSLCSIKMSMLSITGLQRAQSNE